MKKEHKNFWEDINKTIEEADSEIVRIVTEYGQSNNNGGYSIEFPKSKMSVGFYVDDENGNETIYAEIISVSVDKNQEILVKVIDDSKEDIIYQVRLDSVYKHLNLYDAVVLYEKIIVDSLYKDLEPIFNDKETYPTDLIRKVMDKLAEMYSNKVTHAKETSKDAIYELGMDLFNQSVELLEKNNDLAKSYANAWEANSEDEYWWDEVRDDLTKEFLINNI